MVVCCSNNVLSLLLSVTIVVGGTRVPPIQHSHSGGDKPHDHGATAERVAGHHHDDDRHLGDTNSSHILRFEVADSVPHVHVSWFGITVTFPATDRSHAPDHTLAADFCDVSVISQEKGIFGAPTPNPLAFVTTFAASQFSLTAAMAPSAFRSIPAAFTPLCDAARHERSGVQLA